MMLENEKKSFLERTSTRREFLKMTGKGMAGIAVSYSVLSLFGCSPKEEDVTGYALATGLLIADRSRCSGCQRCEMACTVANDGKASAKLARVKVSRSFYFGTTEKPSSNYRYEDGHFGNFLMTPETCKQCSEPACGEACPVGAIEAAPNTGTRVVNVEKCVGCGMCTEACPWHLPTVDSETGKSTKCILCGACAEHCCTGALRVIPWEEVSRVMKKHGYSFA
ncbi:ferredoxin-like protein [Alkaliphilus crotonatoxidans]